MAWFAMSDQFVTDPKIERVGEECGPVGPLAAVALLCQAKIQNSGGRVEGTFRKLAHDAYCTRDEAVSALRALVSAGVLTLESEDDTSFLVSFPNWRRWQEAFRKARSRAHEQADVRSSPQVSRARPQVSPNSTSTTTDRKTPFPADEWGEWLGHYHEVTGRTLVTGTKEAKGFFAARLRERPLADLKLATIGSNSDEFCRQNFNTPTTILRESKIERYIELGRRVKEPKGKGPRAQSRAAQMAELGGGA